LRSFHSRGKPCIRVVQSWETCSRFLCMRQGEVVSRPQDSRAESGLRHQMRARLWIEHGGSVFQNERFSCRALCRSHFPKHTNLWVVVHTKLSPQNLDSDWAALEAGIAQGIEWRSKCKMLQVFPRMMASRHLSL